MTDGDHGSGDPTPRPWLLAPWGRVEGHRWSAGHADEFLPAILSLLVVVAGTFVIILLDTWLGIALVAVAAVLYFVLSFLQIGASRRRVAAQLDAFERKKRHQRRWR